MFQKILVPLDGSRMAAAVLPKVAELAAAMNAQVTLIHVCSRHAPMKKPRMRRTKLSLIFWQVNS